MNEYYYYKVEVTSKKELLDIINNLYDKYIDNFISTLQDTIKHINTDITSCISNLNKFSNENKSKNEHSSEIDYLMNIYTLLNKIKKLLNGENVRYDVIINNLNEWSLLLRYICLLLYIKKDNYSIIYLNELIEYSSTFYNISKIITNIKNEEELSHSFYMKKYDNDTNIFNVKKQHNLNPYSNLQSNDIIIREVFPKIADIIDDKNLLDNFNDILLNPNKDFIIKHICQILTRQYIQSQLTIKVYTYKEYYNKSLDNYNNIITIVANLKEKLNENLLESINIINSDNADNIIKDDKKQMLMNVLDNIIIYIRNKIYIEEILKYITTIININLYLFLLNKYDNLIINIEFYKLLKFIYNIKLNKFESFKSINFEIEPKEILYTDKDLNTYLNKKGFIFSNNDIDTIKAKIKGYSDELKDISLPSTEPETAPAEPALPAPLQPAVPAITISYYNYKEYINTENNIIDNIILIINKLKDKFNSNLNSSIDIINTHINNLIPIQKKKILNNVLDYILSYLKYNTTKRKFPIINSYIDMVDLINKYLYILGKYEELLINLELYKLLTFINNLYNSKPIEKFYIIDIEKEKEIKFPTINYFNLYLYSEKNFNTYNLDSYDIINNIIYKLPDITHLIPPPKPAAKLETALPEHKKIHIITNINDVRVLSDNNNILIIKYGALGCSSCVDLDEPFKESAKNNDKKNYRYCKITYKEITHDEFQQLINANIMENKPFYPFIKIYKSGSLYSIRNYNDYDYTIMNTITDVEYYMKELNKLLQNGFSDLADLTPVKVNLQPEVPAPATPEAPATKPVPAPPATKLETALPEHKKIHNIENFNTFAPYMKSDKLIIIIYYKYTLNDDILLEYTNIAANNTNDKIIFLKININVHDEKIKGFIENHVENLVNIERLPAIMIYFKAAAIYILTANIINELNNKMIELNQIMIDYDTKKCTEIISQEHMFILKKMFDILIIKCSAIWCGPCKTVTPEYTTFASSNEYKNIIYTAIDGDTINKDLQTFMRNYEILEFPTLVILIKDNIIKQYKGLGSVTEIRTYLSSDEFERLLSELELKLGGANKYKKTDKQITVIYKKKEYTRVIYICERKKYVKINKTFMLLSKLKKV
jgi:thiol-disulfide isomerase/thioredoxin